MMIDPNHIRLAHTGTMVTTTCNLKCKLCCVGTPFLAEKLGELSYEKIVRTYDIYFKLIEHVGKFSLGGGEPFLRKELPQLVEHFMQYRDKFDVLEVITNGTRMPSQELLNVLTKYREKVTVLVDNYGPHSPLADQVGAILSENNIPNQVRVYHGEECHCGGWVDLGDFTQKHFDKKSQRDLFERCAYFTETTKIGVCACNGLLYTCGRAYLSLQKGVIKKELPYFVDLLDPTKSVDELRSELIALLNVDVPSACAYCNGMCQDSERFMPAEQME